MATEATKDRQHRRVRRAAEDEAIRHSTREQLTQANNQEKAVLRNQISEALEKGDTETAKTLLSLLERLDQGRSPTTTTE
jgi:thioredoxin-like negative regulator of GroEL